VSTPELVPGLAGVPAAESSVSFIDGTQGILAYRGHRIEVLAEKSTFEETTWLLWNGVLPTRAQLDAFKQELQPYYALTPELVAALKALPRQGHPMEALQAMVAMLGMVSPACDLKDEASRHEASLRVLAAVPVLVACFERLRRGEELVEPDPSLSIAANFLWCMNGVKPSAIEERILDCALVLHAEHTMNASTFACRVVASTETGAYTAVSGAVGTLYGPLHGGANERVLKQLEEIGGPENAKAWFDAKVGAKAKVMGLGHRVYKTKDPRAHSLQNLARELFESHGSTPLYDTALEIERLAADTFGSRGIWPNVDFFSGIVYQKLGIPTDVFTPIFAIARTAGWLAHWREQMGDNKLFRPGQIYTGVHDAEWKDLDDRG
jgi:citrate synthase